MPAGRLEIVMHQTPRTVHGFRTASRSYRTKAVMMLGRHRTALGLDQDTLAGVRPRIVSCSFTLVAIGSYLFTISNVCGALFHCVIRSVNVDRVSGSCSQPCCPRCER